MTVFLPARGRSQLAGRVGAPRAACSTEFPDASRSAPLPMTAARVVSSPVVTSMMGMSAKACPTDMVAVLGSETVGSGGAESGSS